MRETGNAQARPYHHGDLSRALVDAARRILEAEGAAALSLRAVAREAGVSPAAPYHHFKDKTELLEVVAYQGWDALGAAIVAARKHAASPLEALNDIGLAYVHFARENPALYRLMYDTTRDRTAMPEHDAKEESGYFQVQEAIVAAGADPNDGLELQLATVAAWCAVHGLAEMACFKEFQPLREAMGGDDAFLRAVLQHYGGFTRGSRRKPGA
ncbi:MAG TPA: TetR/AcrR family transcriptional regulator [Caulobacteraceae bacterium]|nr:TetR/AcrR family transcriptional regulator [Caulobacteraceae bacterium]